MKNAFLGLCIFILLNLMPWQMSLLMVGVLTAIYFGNKYNKS